MSRYFIELAYKGTKYSGFQVQENANTIQAEVERAFKTLHRVPVMLTGSSRTDAGVHALQNFFHFDFDDAINPQFAYKMNAILPPDITIRNIFEVPLSAHSRFDATSREYVYCIHQFKNPFVRDTSLYFPFKLDIGLMRTAAGLIIDQTNFFAFAKTNSQVKTFDCTICKSEWIVKKNLLLYNVEANRFLRGMVRSLTATLLKLGRHKLSLEEFKQMFEGKRKCGFSVPAQGLFLKKVKYPENYIAACR